MDALSLTELRQNLFQIADGVIDTGEAVVIERRGVRLRLVREDAAIGGRLARLKAQQLVIGPPLKPDESPALWSEPPLSAVAETVPTFGAPAKRPKR